MAEEDKKDLVLTRAIRCTQGSRFQSLDRREAADAVVGPQGFTTPVAELDVRPGGTMNVVMEDTAGLIQKGSRYPMEGTYQEIVPPERLVFTSSAVMDGKPVLENETTVTFEEVDGKTRLTLHVVVSKVAPEGEGPLAGMKQGWSQSLDKLAVFVRS